MPMPMDGSHQDARLTQASKEIVPACKGRESVTLEHSVAQGVFMLSHCSESLDRHSKAGCHACQTDGPAPEPNVGGLKRGVRVDARTRTQGQEECSHRSTRRYPQMNIGMGLSSDSSRRRL